MARPSGEDTAPNDEIRMEESCTPMSDSIVERLRLVPDLLALPEVIESLVITVRGIGGDVILHEEFSSSDPPAFIADKVSRISGIPPELLQLIQSGQTEPFSLTQCRTLFSCGIRNQDNFTCVRLPYPTTQWDTIGLCDGCDQFRHLFYGYSEMLDWEPVVAFCEACGGRPARLPWMD